MYSLMVIIYVLRVWYEHASSLCLQWISYCRGFNNGTFWYEWL